MFGDTHDRVIVLDEEDHKKLKFLKKAYSESKTLTYPSSIRYFETGKGKDNNYLVEVMLSYRLSWFVLPSSLEDGLDTFVFP